MATETGPDLADAALAVALLMDDTCVVSPPIDPDDWVLGADLRLTPPAGMTTYSGPCKFKAQGLTAGTPGAEGGVQLGLDRFEFDLPLGSPRLVEGSVVLITSSRRSPSAVGERLVVKGPLPKTMAVKDGYIAERRKRVEG